ncbi:MAG TPA: phosphatase PAP2 family protein [Candidatus Dormibacteraeota bacterium]|nr:phosphatase PAP2 family protein [Candidatus Dormibacteraeota bacterium]
MQPQGNMRRFMVPAVIIYVVATTAFLVWRGISVSPDYFVFILLLGAVALGRWKAFIVDWMPFVVLFIGYEFLRGFAGKTGIAPHYTEVIAIDRVLGLGEIPTLRLQSWFYRGASSPLEVVCTLFYFLHFAYPLTLGYVFWIRERSLFRRFAACLLAMSLAAFVFFLLVPVAPPWLASQQGLLPHVEKIISHTLPSSTDFIYKSMTPNKVAAFPSLHAAFPALGMLYGIRLFGWKAMIPLGGWVVAVTFSIVYLGEHYIIDALAGFAIAAAAFAVVEYLSARFRKPGEPDARLGAVEAVDRQ